jgi:hypothetical protein
VISAQTFANDPLLVKDKYRLSVDQANILILRREHLQFQKELLVVQAQLEKASAKEKLALRAEIDEINELLAIAETLVTNVSIMTFKEQQRIAMLVRGAPLSALDTALNKALNSNLPELLKNLSSNEAARKEVIRLRSILKQQSLARREPVRENNSVALADNEFVAEEEFLRLLSLFSNDSADEAEDKLIRITGTRYEKPYIQEEILSFLGHEQFYAEAFVHPGAVTFSIDGHSWQLQIDLEEGVAEYIIIYDLSNLIEPRLVMFNKLLLSE